MIQRCTEDQIRDVILIKGFKPVQAVPHSVAVSVGCTWDRWVDVNAILPLVLKPAALICSCGTATSLYIKQAQEATGN